MPAHRRRRSHRWLKRIGAGLVLAVVLGWVAINGYGAWYIAHDQTGPRLEASPASVGLVAEDVSYTAGLHAWYIPGATSQPMIVVVHGSKGNRSSSLAAAKGLHQRGYPLLLISLAYDHGRAAYGGGQHEVAEIREAVSYAHTRATGPVVLLGYSLGGFEVSAAAAQGVDVSAVISDSGFVSFQSQASDHGHLPLPVFSLMPVLYPRFSGGGHLIDVSHIVPRDYHVPTLVIQGTADTMVAVHQGRDLARDLHAQLWLVAGVGHADTYRVMPQTYLDHLDAFIASATGAA